MVVPPTSSRDPAASLNDNFLTEALANHPDQETISELISDARTGVSIGYKGERKTIFCENWPSSYEHWQHVNKFIHDNVKINRVEGPLGHLPTGYRTSPIGAFTRKRNGSEKVRIIHDLSWPHGDSVNDGIDSDMYSIKYSSVDDAVHMLSQYKEPWCAKTDLANAYQSVHVNPKDRPLLGFSWPDEDGIVQYYMMAVLPFGMASSPALFGRYADIVTYIAKSQGAADTTLNYADDYLTCEGSYSKCMASLQILTDTARKVGFDIQQEKTVLPCNVIEFLGIIIDCVNRQLRISGERMDEIYELLYQSYQRPYMSKREMLSLVGKLIFCSKVVRDGARFTRRLIQLTKRTTRLHHRIKVTRQARADIAWWIMCLQSHNGVSWFPRKLDMQTANIVFTDAADGAAGILYNNSWSILTFTGEHQWMKSMNIAWKELMAVVLCIATFGHLLQNSQVAMNIDNEAVCYCINSAKSKDAKLMGLIRALYYYTTMYKIDYHAFHLYTDENASADALSRLDMNRFYRLNPSADSSMTPPASIIYDFE